MLNPDHSSQVDYKNATPQKYSKTKQDSCIPDRAHAHSSNQTRTETYDQPYMESTNRIGVEELDSCQSHRKHTSDSQGAKASERHQKHSSDQNKSHVSDKSHRNTTDAYPTRTPKGYPPNQVPARPQVPASYPRFPSQQPTTAQQYPFFQTHVGQPQCPPHHQFPVPQQQVPPGMYPFHPSYGPHPPYGVYQQQQVPPSRYMTFPPHTHSPSHSVPHPNSPQQGYPVSQQYPAHLIPPASQMQGTTQPFVQPLGYKQNHAQNHRHSDSLRKSSSEPPRLRPSMVSETTVQSPKSYAQQHLDRSQEPQHANHPSEQRTDLHTSKSRKSQSSEQSEERLTSDCSTRQKPDLSDHAPATTSEIPALVLVGNPGAGKSTILNGVAGNAVFPAGISLGSGLTTSVKEHFHDGVALYDTPGLADVERKKQAGRELNALLSKQIALRIAFVVTLERGRVRPEDALTIDLVLDSIRVDTDDRFGVVINRVTKRVGEEIKASPEKEAKIRCSLTGKHKTFHWCHVSMREDLEDESDGKLMTAELDDFFSKLPVTKPKDARTVPIDTDSMEEKMEKHIDLIRDIEAANAEQLRRMAEELMLQKAKYAAQESQLRREEQNLVNEIQRLKAEAAATKETREKVAREARSRRPNHGENRGSRQQSRTPTTSHVPTDDLTPPLVSASGAGNNDDGGSLRSRHEIGRGGNGPTHESGAVPIVEGILEEEDLRRGHANIDGRREQIGSCQRPYGNANANERYTKTPR